MSQPAVFLDRDGTLIRERGFIADPAEVEILPGVVEALAELRAAGYAPVVVTNQSGIARGLFGEADLARVHRHLHDGLRGAPLAYFHCPHHPEAGSGAYTRACECRKPGSGLLHQAARTLDLELDGSFMVGDAARDVLAARGTPLRTVLLQSGVPWEEQRAQLASAGVAADLVAADLAAATAWILAQAR